MHALLLHKIIPQTMYATYMVWLVMCMVPLTVHAQKKTATLSIEAGKNHYDGIQELLLLPDHIGDWRLIDAEHAFKKLNAFDIQSVPLQRAVYWGKITLSIAEPAEYNINIGQAQNVQVWLIHNGQVSQQAHTGTWVPLKERSVQETRLSMVHLSFPAPGTYDLYIRWNFIKPQKSHRIFCKFYPTKQWVKDNGALKVLQGLFQGIMLIFFLYNLAKFFTSRDQAFLYYSLFVLFFGCYHLFFYGLGLEYIYPNYPKIDEYVWLISTHLASIFYILFVKWFCNLSISYPKIWEWLKAYLIIKGIELAGVLLLLQQYADYDLLGNLQRILFFGEEVFFVIIMVWLWRVGNHLHRYLVVGTIVFAISIGITILASVFWHWDLHYYPIIMQVGALLKIFIFSLGLGYRVRLKDLDKQQLQADLIIQLKENKRLQEQANKELEHKVIERTKELIQKNEQILLQHRNITAQNRQLRMLNAEQDNLIKIVAHDLKSPLNRLEGMMGIFKLSIREQSSSYEDYFTIIQQSISSQKMLISRILTSENAKGVSIHIEQLNLSQLFQSLVRLFELSASAKEIQIISEIPKMPVVCYTDDTLINAIIENLLSNAIKFSPFGKKIWFKLQENQESVTIAITDEGPGFTEDDRQRMFARYQKLSAQPTNGEDSTGLGLSIVKQYAEVLGGQLTCESIAGNGATFTLNLAKGVQ